MPIALSQVAFGDEPDVGPARSGYRLPERDLPEAPRRAIPLSDVSFDEPKGEPSLADRVAARFKLGLARAASEPAGPAALLHGAAEALGGQGTSEAIDARAAHAGTAGLIDEGLGLAAGAKNLLLPPSAGGGATVGDAVRAGVEARDAERKKQKDLAAEHPIATGLTDAGTAFLPGATARLAVQGFGDSEAKDAKGLIKDTAIGAGTAAVLHGTGLAIENGAGWLGREVSKRLAPKAAASAAKAAENEAGAAWAAKADDALKAPELAEPSVRATPKTRPELFEPGDEYRFAGADDASAEAFANQAMPGGKTRTEALMEAIGGKPAAAEGRGFAAYEPAPPGTPKPRTPAPAEPAPVPAEPKKGSLVRDLATAAAGEYAVDKIGKQLGIPPGLVTTVLLAKKLAGSSAAKAALGNLIERAHQAGVDAATAGLIAQQLPQSIAPKFLESFVTHDEHAEASP